MKIKKVVLHKHIFLASKVTFWFFLGVFLGLFFFVSFVFIFYQNSYKHVVYPGVFVNGIDFGGKTQQQVRYFFAQKNSYIGSTKFFFSYQDSVATISAKQLKFGYDENLLAQQAFSIGRSDNLISNISLLLQAYINGVHLPASYHYDVDMLTKLLAQMQGNIHKDPIDAQFALTNERVTAFRLSQNGQDIDMNTIQNALTNDMLTIVSSTKPPTIVIPVPVLIVKPTISSDKANNLGITELVSTGTSLFHGSIDSRIYNISLAARRLNGVLIPPGQIFSFDKAVGDISSLSGYKQAYVIQNGHTVLGDGGGVCQVSTTMFRTALNAGLPIVERNPHAYRVHYYEEDSGPGIDAAIYSPTVDLKFKNDTDHYILIQTIIDLNAERLTFNFYGTKDDRQVTIGTPVVLSQTPAPDPLNQDDPTLPAGTVKQIDFSAAGANVYFTRTVSKNGIVYISDKFVSNYRPWQAVYLHGTKTK